MLVEKQGGPSVRPYMPPGIWSSISNAKYKRDDGESLYRRSLYTYWRRTVPPPTMMTFNAAARETCVVRNDQTTTPLQALTLMNNVAFVEAARHLASQVLAVEGVAADERVRQIFARVISRDPQSNELERLLDDLRSYHDDFRKHPKSADRLLAIGQSANDPRFKAVELAAYTLVANTVLNLDEAITEN